MNEPVGFPVSALFTSSHHARFLSFSGTVMSQRPLKSLLAASRDVARYRPVNRILFTPPMYHARLRVDLFAPGQHFHKLLNASVPRFGLLCIMKAKQNRIAIPAIQGTKESLGALIAF